MQFTKAHRKWLTEKTKYTNFMDLENAGHVFS